MIINNTQFNCELSDILIELKGQLASNGIQRFEKMFDSGDDIMTQCPYHGNGQERKPSFGIRKSDALGHCFRADTEIITSSGIKRIGVLDGTCTAILNGNGDWENVRIRNYGEQKLWKIELSQDQLSKTIFATAEHKWFIKKLHKTYQTNELKAGWYLDSLIMSPTSFKVDVEGVIHGIIYGDGTRNIRYATHRHGKNARTIDHTDPRAVYYVINIPKFTKKSLLLDFFKNSDMWSFRNRELKGKEYWNVCSKSFNLSHNYKIPPEINLGRDYLMSFLAGYFACDGSYDLMRIYSSKVEDLIKVQNIFIRCGVSVRKVKEIVRNTNYLDSAFGGELFVYPMSLPQEFFLLDKPKLNKYSRSRWKIVLVEPTDLIESVYCCETSTQSFVLADNILTHNCFACDKTVSIDEMISNCFGYSDPTWGYRWLIQNFNTVSVEERKDIELDLDRVQKKDSCTQCFVSEEELDSYRYIHPYMYKRGLIDAVIDAFDIGYDKQSDSITFPVRYWGSINNGKCLFVAKRSVKTKRFDLPKNMEKPLYGLYEFWRNIELGAVTDEVYICEGLFDSLRLWCNGKVALAGFGCLFSEYQIKLIEGLPVRKLILALDNDEAGRKATEKLKKRIKNKLITEVVIPNGHKDIGELSDEEIQNLEEVF